MPQNLCHGNLPASLLPFELGKATDPSTITFSNKTIKVVCVSEFHSTYNPSFPSIVFKLSPSLLFPTQLQHQPPLLIRIHKLTIFLLTCIKMETLHHGVHEKALKSPHPSSPNSTSTSSSSNGTPTIGVLPPSPLTPKPISRSIDGNPYPTTFIQADTSSFKHVVQMLTGSAETAAKHAASPPATKNSILPATKATGPKKPSFKLHERRGGLKNLKMISPRIPTFMNSNQNSPAGAAAFSPWRQPEILSPSILDLPSLTLSPVTPLIHDPFNRSAHPGSAPVAVEAASSAEEQAITEKGFYLHPSPRAEGQPPRLLPLFPLTSPRVSSASVGDSYV